MKVFRIESQLGLQTGIPGYGLLGGCLPYMVMLSGNGSVVELIMIRCHLGLEN